ncbi:MAG: hypothetical protein HY211_07010 [Candidatus Omnitrophica bacterium]|nr:hypothetical protein [Candidatus Omnitrophota bacterium]
MAQFDPLNPDLTPAPILGVRYLDGQWSADINNPQSISMKVPPSNTIHPRGNITGMRVDFLQNTTSVVQVKVSYDLNRFPLLSNDSKRTVLDPGGPGFYECTITLEDREPDINVLEDTNGDIIYSVQVDQGLDPTQARWRGHHATSITEGRDWKGNLFAPPGQRQDAFRDLQFTARWVSRPLAGWDHWIFDMGWTWVMYNLAADSTANLFGLYSGPASKLLGTGGSGTCVYTGPGAVSSVISKVDASGNRHEVWQSSNGLLYMRTDAAGQSSPVIALGPGLINPNMHVDGVDKVSITAFDPYGSNRVGNFVWLSDSAGSGQFQKAAIDVGPNFKILDPYAYTAYSPASQMDLLVIYGDDGTGQKGLYLFTRNGGTHVYTLQDRIDAYTGEVGQVRRPILTTLADGRVVMVFTEPGGYAEYTFVSNGKFDRTHLKELFNKYRLLNFGTGIDPQTGRIVVANSTGAMNLLLPSGLQLATSKVTTTLNIPLDHSGQGPNHRTVATDQAGNTLATHNKGLSYLFEAATGAWRYCTELNQAGISPASISYNPNSQFFEISGRASGRLAHFTYKVGDAAPVLAQDYPQVQLNSAGLQIVLTRTSADARYFPEVRIGWGIYIGTKADLGDPRVPQPINKVMNRKSGLADGRLSVYETSNYPNSAAITSGGLFMDAQVVRGMIQRVRTDRNYYNYLRNAEPSARPLIDAWKDGGAKNSQEVDNIVNQATKMKNAWIDGDGINDFQYDYWMAGLPMLRDGFFGMALLADPNTTPTHQDRIKATFALYGGVLWDDDFVAFQPGAGVNLGTANMPVQYGAYRDLYSLLLSTHPDFTQRAQGVAQRTLTKVHKITNAYGAEMGSTHYISASMEPVLVLALALKQLRILDLFNAAVDDRLALFSEFYMNLLTPPQKRFGGVRKKPANGDGSTESSEIEGLLATGFRDTKPALSARLMGAWYSQGKRHSGFFGTTLLMINEAEPRVDPDLRDANFPGYYSVLRHGWGTPDESACWIHTGNFYEDHSYREHGSEIVYALTAPISILWGSFYSPSLNNHALSNMVVPASMIPWADQQTDPNTVIPLLANRSGWGAYPTPKDFTSFLTSGFSQADFPSGSRTWTRSVYNCHAVSQAPILFFRDGLSDLTPMVFNMNLMAAGPVDTPSGSITPPLVDYANGGAQPILGLAFTIPSGVQKLRFTGQWGVDFDLYSVSPTSQDARISAWRHHSHPSSESSEFKKATGRSFEETQDILHVKGVGGFRFFLVPYPTGKVSPYQVSWVGQNVVFTDQATGAVTTVDMDGNFYAYQDGTRSILTTYNTNSQRMLGIAISGGTTEVITTSTSASITVDGKAGIRTVSLPGSWQIPPNFPLPPGFVTYNSSQQQFIINYPGGNPGQPPITVPLIPKTDTTPPVISGVGVSKDAVGNGAVFGDLTFTTLAPPQVTAPVVSGMVKVASGAAGNRGAVSVTVRNAIPSVIPVQPSNQGVGAGQPATFTVTATGTALLGYPLQQLRVVSPTAGGSVTSAAGGSTATSNLVSWILFGSRRYLSPLKFNRRTLNSRAR